jgi:hypothetical protein
MNKQLQYAAFKNGKECYGFSLDADSESPSPPFFKKLPTKGSDSACDKKCGDDQEKGTESCGGASASSVYKVNVDIESDQFFSNEDQYEAQKELFQDYCMFLGHNTDINDIYGRRWWMDRR